MKKLLLTVLLSTGLYASEEESNNIQQDSLFELDFNIYDDYIKTNSEQTIKNLFDDNTTTENHSSLFRPSSTNKGDYLEYSRPNGGDTTLYTYYQDTNITNSELPTVLSEPISSKTTSLPILDLKIEVNKKFFDIEKHKETSFDDSRILKSHIKSKINKKQYQCEYKKCNKSFHTNYLLKRHMKSHTGIKEYQCTVEGCNKSFLLKFHLKEHNKTHTDTKNHICPYQGCNQSFYQYNNLKEHIKTHTDTKNHICQYCDRAFTQVGTLYRHIRTKHKDFFTANTPEE